MPSRSREPRSLSLSRGNRLRYPRAFDGLRPIVSILAIWAFGAAGLVGAGQEAPSRPAPVEPRRSSGNRTLPAVRPPDLEPRFSAPPTDAELFQARVFDGPLVPLEEGDASSNQGVAEAVRAYVRASRRDDFSAFETYLRADLRSRWRASLLANLAVAYRQAGYFSRSLAAAQEAWDLSKGSAEAYGRSTAEIALGQLAALHSRLGHLRELQDLLEEVGERPLTGAVTEHVSAARQALVTMRENPEVSFRCGPLAVASIFDLQGGREGGRKTLEQAHSTPEGTSLVRVEELARSVGLKMRAARRGAGAATPVPSVIHFRSGHFAALIKKVDGRYLLKDPTFGDEGWVSEEALIDEGSGYYLVQDDLPTSLWPPATREEAGRVWGRGIPAGSNADDVFCSANQSGGGSAGGGGGCACSSGGMARYSFHTMLASLRIADTPVGYSAAVGPSLYFSLVYLQRDAFWPEIPRFTNFGPQWTSDWVSWIEDDPASPAQTLRVYVRGGGVERLAYKPESDPPTEKWGPFFMTDATVVRTSASPIRYERRMPDGSVEVYAQPDSYYSLTRRVFLTEVRDPQGNAVKLLYDDQFRLVALSDAVGQVSNLSYDLTADPFKVTKFTDPFGRAAQMEYDAQGRLVRITDVVNLSSSFDYDAGSFVRSMTTPYGTTTFRQSEVGYEVLHPLENKTVFVNRRAIEATDPMGATERVEFWPAYPTGLPPETFTLKNIPDAFINPFIPLEGGFSLYWDKRAMAIAPKEPRSGDLTLWRWSLDGVSLRSVPYVTRKPLEYPVWYGSPGTSLLSRMTGSTAQPSTISRVLDDDVTEQTSHREYSKAGKLVERVDALGRETVYVYGTGSQADSDPARGTGIDLLEVKQKTVAAEGVAYEKLWRAAYDARHLPLTTTDATGQATTYTYNARGQVLTTMTPPWGDLSEAERTTTYSYLPDSDVNGPGRLEKVTGPTAGSVTSYSYDGYGRVRTTTDSDGYTHSYEYDALDRVTKVTYPDLTHEETTYDRLDAVARRDRQGRWTRTFYDAMQRVTSVLDPLGRTTVYDWCPCGTLEKVVDGNGNATRWERDLQGRIIREVRADGATWETTYETTTSRVKQRKDPKGQVASYEYFLDDNLKRTSYSNAAVATPEVTYTYDPRYNRVATMTDGTGTTTYSYHAVGEETPTPGATQLASVDGPLADDTVLYTYDELGRLASRGLTGLATTFAYDSLGRVTTIGTSLAGPPATPPGNFTYTYDGVTPRPLTLTYPNGQQTQYTYLGNDDDRHLGQIKHRVSATGATLSQFDYAYTDVGNIRTWTQQVGANPAKVYAFGYDAADQLTSARISGPPALPVPSRFSYAYDKTGNRTGEQLDDAATQASYNARNQLTTRQPGGALLFRGTVDEPATVTVQGKPAEVSPTGTPYPFTGQAQVPPGTSSVVVTATDPRGNVSTKSYQVKESGSTTSYTYDLNGNLTSDGTKTYEWDAENRLTAVKQGTTALASFTYDGLGQRRLKVVGGTTRTYVYDGVHVAEERLSGAATGTIRYYHGASVDDWLARQNADGSINYFLADHLGSIVQETNSTGAVTLTRSYDPWGNLDTASTTTSGLAYTGREWDAEIGLYNYRARYYVAGVGRFLSEDPIGIAAGPNHYAYVDGDPINIGDPLGLSPAQRGSKTSPRLECSAICAMAYADSKQNYGGGGVVCYQGQKCACVFDNLPAKLGECPQLDAIVRKHEERHVPESSCPSSTLCRAGPSAPFALRGLECIHRKESVQELSMALGTSTPECKKKIQVIMLQLLDWLTAAKCPR